MIERDKSFFTLVDDPKFFEFNNINLIKYFYDEYENQKLFNLEPVYRKDLINKNRWLSLVKYLSPVGFTKALIFMIKVRKSKKEKVLFYGSSDNRHVNVSGVIYDLYNYNIIRTLSREKVIIFQNKRDTSQKVYPTDLCLMDFAIPQIFLLMILLLFRFNKLRKFASQINKKYSDLGFTNKKIIWLTIFFWAKYYVYTKVLSFIKVKSVLSICHYSKHPFNLACKRNSIPNVELMHGHVMKSHTKYNIPNLPPQFYLPMRTLLPDKFGAYGNYWKENLIYGKLFDEKQIELIGYYLLADPLKKKNKINGKVTILITTQAFVQKEILEYVKFLKDKLSSKNVKIIIKPHPAEDPNEYIKIKDDNLVYVSTDDIYQLLNMSDVHIGVYSTVLFEAIRYNVINYVLYTEKFSHFCDEIIQSRVALKLKTEEIPSFENPQEHNTEYYFAEYNERLLKRIVFDYESVN